MTTSTTTTKCIACSLGGCDHKGQCAMLIRVHNDGFIEGDGPAVKICDLSWKQCACHG